MMKPGKLLMLALLFCSTSILYAQTTKNVSSDETLYRDAMDCMAKEQYASARNLFEKYVSLGKSDLLTVESHYRKAYCALQLQNGDAESLYLNFLKAYPENIYVNQSYLDLGEYYFNKGQYDKTVEYLSQLNMDELLPEQRTDASFQLGYAYFTKQDFEGALKNFNIVKKANKHRYQYAACYYAAYIEFKNEAYDESLADLKIAEADETYKSLVAVLKANILYRKGDYDGLIAYAEDLIKSNPNHKDVTEVYILTGDAYFNKKDYAKAAEYFTKVISADASRNNAEMQYRIAYCQYMSGKYPEAAIIFKNIAVLKDSIGQASSYYLGLSYLKQNNKQYALLPLDNARKIGYNLQMQEEAWFLYGKINFELTRYTEATHAFKQFLKVYPNSSRNEEASELITECYLASTDYDEALLYIEGLRYANNPRINAAYQKLAYHKAAQLYNDGNYDDALKIFDKSLKYSMYDKEYLLGAYYWKGEIYSIKQEWANAIQYYSQVFQRDPGGRSPFYLKSRYGIGYAYYNSKKYDDALPHFREYVRILEKEVVKPYYEDAIIRMADCYYALKQFDEALKNYNKALDRTQKDADYVWYQKALVYTLKNKYEDARTAYTQLINSYPQSVYLMNAIYFRAKLDLDKGEDQRAYDGFSVVIKKSPEANIYLPNTYLNRALALTNLDRKEEAINDYKYILEHFPSNPLAEEAIKGIQPLLTKLGREDEFNELLTRYKEGGGSGEGLASIEFKNAQDLYTLGKYDKSIPALSNFINRYPGDAKVQDAKYILAESYFKNNEPAKAQPLYDQFLTDKTNIYYNRCLVRTAEINLNKKDYKKASQQYKGLLDVAGSKREKIMALERLVDCHEALANYDSVKYYGNELVNVPGVSMDTENKTHLAMARACMKKKEYDLATDYCLSVINNAKDVAGAEAKYMLGTIQFQKGEYMKSMDTFSELGDQYSSYEPWVSRAYYMIAENYVALGDLYQAKGTLSSLVDGSPDQETVDKSKARIVELEAIEKGAKQ